MKEQGPREEARGFLPMTYHWEHLTEKLFIWMPGTGQNIPPRWAQAWENSISKRFLSQHSLSSEGRGPHCSPPPPWRVDPSLGTQLWHSGEEYRLCSQTSWVQIFLLPLSSCETLGKFVKVSGPQWSICKMGMITPSWVMVRIEWVRTYLGEFLAHSICSVNVSGIIIILRV